MLYRLFPMRLSLLLGILFLGQAGHQAAIPLIAEAREAPAQEGSVGIISDFEARLTLARLLASRAHGLDEAIRQYGILLGERPKDPQVALELAQMLIRKQRYAEAVQQIQMVLALKPQDPEALTALARVYLWTGRNEEAAGVFERLGKLQRLPPDVLTDMARAYTWQKEYDKAAGIFETILKNAPSPSVAIELGNVKLYAGHFPEAIANYRKALGMDPGSHSAQRQLALALSWTGQNEEALPLLTRMHELDPRDKEIALALGRTYAASHRSAEAAALFQSLTALYPEDADLPAEWADLEAKEGHAERCRDLYLRALDLADRKEEILSRYAAQMNLWGDFYKVESIYRDIMAARPEDPDVALKLAWVLVSAQRYEEAEGMYLDLLQRNPRWEKVLLDLGRLKLLEKDFGASLAYVERLLASSPQDPDGLFLKGEALFHAGRTEQALAVYKLLAQVEPQQARGPLAAGRTCIKIGRLEEAGPHLAEALRRDPRNAEAQFWAAGQARATSSEFTADLLTQGKESPGALVEWARMYASLGYNSIAISCFEEALRQDPNHFPAQMGLAEVLAVDHQYKRAGEILEALARRFPDASKILITRARVLGWAKHYDASIAVYDAVCALNPSDPVPRKEKARTAAWGKKMAAAMKIYGEAYRNPVDRELADSLETLVREAGDPRLEKLFHQLSKASQKGSIYAGYEAFYQEAAKLSSSLKPEVAARLEALRLRLLPSYRIQKAAFLEGQSKWLAWNRRFSRALDSYKDLIRFQPGNEEALFDCAQVECSLGLCDREATTYGNLLSMDPLHNLAGMGLERQRIRRRPSVEVNHSYWDEEGHGGLSHITRNRTDMTADVPLSCRYHLRVAAHRWLEDPKTKGITYEAYGPTLELNGVLNEFVSGALSWTNKQYLESSLSSTNTGFAQVWLNLRDYARLGVGYDRTDELYNIFGIKQSVQADSFWVGVSSYLTRNLEVKGKAQVMNYTDGNSAQWYSMAAGYAFTDHPRIVKLTVTGDYRNTEHSNVYHYKGSDLEDITHPYWAPQNYMGTAAILEWYHDLSKYFFCGSELHFYDLRLGLGTDTDNNAAVKLEGEWHYEFSDRWTVGIKGLVNRSGQWNATGAWANIRYQF